MRSRLILILIFAVALVSLLFFSKRQEENCLIGAFISDKPTKDDIYHFKAHYGKRPALVMIFVDWENFFDEKTVEDVYGQGSILFITWEPWNGTTREGIDYEGFLSGRYDTYIRNFSDRIKMINKPVFIRFAHEANGDWYPWSGAKIPRQKCVAIYRYVKDIFDKNKVTNAKWVFSVNWEDVPKDNDFSLYYPGDKYADYIGIDGYNWGSTQSWSRWMSFKEIFALRYEKIMELFNKPVLICEFSSTSNGGDKARWITEALRDIKKMKAVKGFVLFNVDKENDWSFPAEEPCGKALRQALKSNYFTQNI